MKRILATVALGGALLAASAAAQARVDVDVGIGVPGVVVAPAPVYHRPVPVYGPRPVYAQSVYAPPPVAYVPAPVVVRPAPVRYGPPYGHAHGWRERHWEERHDHRRWH